MNRIQFLAILISFFLVISIFKLVKERKLKEEYSLLWLFIGTVIFVLALWRNLIYKLAAFLGTGDPNTVLFFFGLTFSLILILHFSVKISLLSEQVKVLIQEVALLENELREREKEQKL